MSLSLPHSAAEVLDTSKLTQEILKTLIDEDFPILYEKVNNLQNLLGRLNNAQIALLSRHFFPIFKQLLEKIHPVASREDFAHRIRNITVDIMCRIVKSTDTSNYCEELMDLLLNVMKHDNEINGSLALRVVYELHFRYANRLESRVRSFFEIVRNLFSNIERLVKTLIEKKGGVPLMLLAKVPLTLKFIFSKHPHLAPEMYKELHPSILTTIRLSPNWTKKVPKQIIADFVLVQTKALSLMNKFLSVLSVNENVQNSEKIVAGIFNLLKSCPTDATGCRKEILCELRDLVENPAIRRGIIGRPTSESIFDEKLLLGPNCASFGEVRPVAYKTMCHIVKKTLGELNFNEVEQFVHIFCGAIHDHTIPLYIQNCVIRRLVAVNDVMIGFKDSHPTSGRKVFEKIFSCFVDKFESIRHLAKALDDHLRVNPGKSTLLLQIPGFPSHITPSRVQMEISVLELQMMQGLMLQGLKPLVYCISLFKKDFTTVKEPVFRPSKRQAVFATPYNPLSGDKPDPAVFQGGLVPSELDMLSNLIGYVMEGLILFEYAAELLDIPPKLLEKTPAAVVARQVLFRERYAIDLSRNFPLVRDLLKHFAGVYTSLDFGYFRHVMGISEERELHQNSGMRLILDYMLKYERISLIIVPRVFVNHHIVSKTCCDIFLLLVKENLHKLADINSKESRNIVILFHAVISTLSMFQDNDKVVEAYMKEIMEESLRRALYAEHPVRYLQILRTLFRGIGGGRFTDLYNTLHTLIEKLLRGLLQIYERHYSLSEGLLATELLTEKPSEEVKSEWEKRRDFDFMITDSLHSLRISNLAIELCLIIPVRLSSLLAVPNLPIMVHAVVLSLHSDNETIILLGVRMLEFWVNKVKHSYLHDHISPRLDELIRALTRLIHTRPHTLGTICARILGKLGGRNRTFFIEEQKLHPLAFNEPINLALKLPNNISVNIPLGEICAELDKDLFKLRREMTPATDIHMRLHAFRFFRGCLISFLSLENCYVNDAVDLAKLRSRISSLSMNTAPDAPPIDFFRSTNIDNNLSHLPRMKDQETYLHLLLCNVIKCNVFPTVRKESAEFVKGISNHFLLLLVSNDSVFVSQRTDLSNVKREISYLDAHVFLRAISTVMTCPEAAFVAEALKVLRGFLENLIKLIGISNVSYLECVHYIMSLLTHLCYNTDVYVQLGAAQGVEYLVRTLSLKWIKENMIEISKAFLFTVRDENKQIVERCTAIARRALRRVIVSCFDVSIEDDWSDEDIVQRIRDAKFDREEKETTLQNLILVFTSELITFGSALRDFTYSMLEFIALCNGQSISEMIKPHYEKLLSPLLNSSLNLGLVAPSMRSGFISATTRCLLLEPPLLKASTELIALLQNSVRVILNDNISSHFHYISLLPGQSLNYREKNAQEALRERIESLKLLSATMVSGVLGDDQKPLQNKIVLAFFQCLLHPCPEVVEAAKIGLQKVNQKKTLPKELLQDCLRPVLQNLTDVSKISNHLLSVLLHLLELLSNWFNATLGEKLLEHLNFFTERLRNIVIAQHKPEHPDMNRGYTELRMPMALISLFRSLPPTPRRFLTKLVMNVVNLQVALGRLKTFGDGCVGIRNPFQKPLLTVLTKYASESVAFFLTPKNILNRQLVELFKSLLRSAGGATLRKTVMLLHHQLIANTFPLDRSDSEVPQTALNELQFQGVDIVYILVDMDKQWLTSAGCPKVLEALIAVWKRICTQFQGYDSTEIVGMHPLLHQWKAVALCLVEYCRALVPLQRIKEGFPVLIDLLFTFVPRSVVNLSFLRQFYNDMIAVLSLDDAMVLLNYFDTYVDKLEAAVKYHALLKIVFPLLQRFSPKNNDESLSDDLVKKILRMAINIPVKTDWNSSPATIAMLPYVKIAICDLFLLFVTDYPQALVEPYVGKLLAFTKNDMERGTLYCGDEAQLKSYVLFVTINSVFGTIEVETIAAVYVKVLKCMSHAHTDTLPPYLPVMFSSELDSLLDLLIAQLSASRESSSSEFPCFIELLVDLLRDHIANIAQVLLVNQLILRNKERFSPYKRLFLAFMFDSISRLISIPGPKLQLCVDVIGLLLDWSRVGSEEFLTGVQKEQVIRLICKLWQENSFKPDAKPIAVRCATLLSDAATLFETSVIDATCITKQLMHTIQQLPTTYECLMENGLEIIATLVECQKTAFARVNLDVISKLVCMSFEATAKECQERAHAKTHTEELKLAAPLYRAVRSVCQIYPYNRSNSLETETAVKEPLDRFYKQLFRYAKSAMRENLPNKFDATRVPVKYPSLLYLSIGLVACSPTDLVQVLYRDLLEAARELSHKIPTFNENTAQNRRDRSHVSPSPARDVPGSGKTLEQTFRHSVIQCFRLLWKNKYLVWETAQQTTPRRSMLYDVCSVFLEKSNDPEILTTIACVMADWVFYPAEFSFEYTPVEFIDKYGFSKFVVKDELILKQDIKVTCMIKLSRFLQLRDEKLQRYYFEIFLKFLTTFPAVLFDQSTDSVRVQSLFVTSYNALLDLYCYSEIPEPIVRGLKALLYRLGGNNLLEQLAFVQKVQDLVTPENEFFYLTCAVDILLGTCVEYPFSPCHPHNSMVDSFKLPCVVDADDEEIAEESVMVLGNVDDFLNEHEKFLNMVVDEDVHQCIVEPLSVLQSRNPNITQILWRELFDGMWRCTENPTLRDELARLLSGMLCKERVAQKTIAKNSAVALLSGFGKAFTDVQHSVIPVLPIRPELLHFAAVNFGCWYDVMFLFEKRLLSHGVGDTSKALLRQALLSDNEDRDASPLTFASYLSGLYKLLGETDIWTGLWLHRVQSPMSVSALTHQQFQYWPRAQKLYFEAMKTRGGVDDHRFGDRAASFEVALWEEEWIACAKHLNQWKELAEFSKGLLLPELSLECSWKLGDWSLMRRLMDTYSVDNTLLGKMHNVHLKVHELTQSLLGNESNDFLKEQQNQLQQYCDVAVQGALNDWRRMPEIVSHSHVELLSKFQQIVELYESLEMLYTVIPNLQPRPRSDGSEDSLPDITPYLIIWRERLPNTWESIPIWNDILTWRSHVFSLIIQLVKHHNPIHATGPGGGFSNLPPSIHDTVWTVVQFASIARKHQLPTVCLSSLANIYSFKSMSRDNLFAKFREQAKVCLQSRDDYAAAVAIINKTDISKFSSLQKAEFLCMKGEALHIQGHGEDSHTAFSTAMTICDFYGEGWLKWGSFCDRICGAKKGKGRLWAGSAVACYLQAARYDTSYSVRLMLSRVLWLFSIDTEENTVISVFESNIDNMQLWLWLMWIPQLLTSLARPEGYVTKKILNRIAQTYPQALYYSIRTYFQEKRDFQTKMTPEMMEADRAQLKQYYSLSSHSQPDVQGQENGSVRLETPATPNDANAHGTEPNSSASGLLLSSRLVTEIVATLRGTHSHLVGELENLLEELARKFKISPDEDLMSLIYAVFLRSLQHLNSSKPPVQNAEGVADWNVIPSWIRTKLNLLCLKFFRNDNQTPRTRKLEQFLKRYGKRFLRDFDVEENNFPKNLDELVLRLKQWKNYFQFHLNRRSREDIPLEYLSTYLMQFQGNGVQIPGQYARGDEPKQHLLVMLESFLPDVSLVFTHGIGHKRVGLRGSDGKDYFFLVQLTVSHITKCDERLMQLYAILNNLLADAKESWERDLQFHIPIVAPLVTNLRLIECPREQISFESLYDKSCAFINIDPDKPLLKYASHIIHSPVKDPKSHNIEEDPRYRAYRGITQHVMPNNVLLRYFESLYTCPEELWMFRREFCNQLGLCGFLAHIMQIGERKLYKLSLSLSSGKITNSEFYPVYSNAPERHNEIECLEHVPFRLTPNLHRFITPFMSSGALTGTLLAAASAVIRQQNQEILKNFLYVFIRDDLSSWIANTHPLILVDDQMWRDIEKEVTDAMKPFNEKAEELISKATSAERLCKMKPTWFPWF